MEVQKTHCGSTKSWLAKVAAGEDSQSCSSNVSSTVPSR